MKTGTIENTGPDECGITELRRYGLYLYQPDKGYRFSVDSLLLAEFASPGAHDAIADMGAGCGVISCILARRFRGIAVTAIEIQPRLAELSCLNARLNGLNDRIDTFQMDIRDVPGTFGAGSLDFIISNPPYRTPVSGRLCAGSQEALARHEILMTLDDLLVSSAFLLKTGGKFAVIYPAERSARLLWAMKQKNIEPKRLQPVYPSEGRKARMVLVEGRKCGGEELTILPPLFIEKEME